jgi:hypothetical protein
MPHKQLHRLELLLLNSMSWVLANLQQRIVEWRLAMLRRKKQLSSCKSTPKTPSSEEKSRTSQKRLPTFLRREPPPLSLQVPQHSLLPRSLNELSQAQLELALLVVHRQLGSHPLVAIWEPPEELSYLPQSEWLCLIEVWEQLLHQRRRSPLQ